MPPVPPEGFVEPSSSFHTPTKEDFPEKDFVTLAPEQPYATTSSNEAIK
jgi:hypothetical protein